MRNGNVLAQEKIIQSFTENHGEKFFKTLIVNMGKNVNVIVQILSELNENKMKKMLKTDIGLDKVDRLGIEMEVSTIDFKIKMIKRVYNFMRMIAEESIDGKNFLRGNMVSMSKFTKARNSQNQNQRAKIKQGNTIAPSK
jgi:hypothetical protein